MRKILTAAAAALAITACTTGAPCAETAAADLMPGAEIQLTPCFIRAHTSLDADIKCHGEFGGITLRRGDLSIFLGAELHITPDSVLVRELNWYEVTEKTQEITREAFSHGLKLGDSFHVSLTTAEHDQTGHLSIKGPGFDFEKDIYWQGGGLPSLSNDGDSEISATLSFTRGDVGRKIWFLADSYFDENDQERWPCHMWQEGHRDNWMVDHVPGGCSVQMLECFENDLCFGTPETAVWMLGMNDPDDPRTGISQAWLTSTQRFLEICREKGITPVLTTVPSVPERCHDFKEKWVRESGERFIDWSAAVDACPWDGSEGDRASVEDCGMHRGWRDGLLYEDNVHPTAAGAAALWEQVKKDLPEILR